MQRIKDNFFAFLTHKIEEWSVDKCVYITSGDAVISLGGHSPMGHCHYEEADTRNEIDVTHTLQPAAKVVRTVDTNEMGPLTKYVGY